MRIRSAAFIGTIAVAAAAVLSSGCAKKADEAQNTPPSGADKSAGVSGSPGAAGQQSSQPQIPTGAPP